MHTREKVTIGESSVAIPPGLRMFGMNKDAGTNGWRQLVPNALPILLEALQAEDSRGARGYAILCSKAPYFIERSLPRPREDAAEMRWGALALISNNPDQAKPLAPYLARVLSRSRDAHVREAACAALSEIGAGGSAAVAALQQALQDSDTTVRRTATNGLLKIDSAAASRAGIKQGTALVGGHSYTIHSTE